jgi:enoyl-CoA hydratase/carnithine racemase
MSEVHLTIDGPIARMILDQPGKKNAIDRSMWQALASHCDHIEADRAVKLLVLQGAGDCFSSGADLSEMQAMLTAGESLEPNYSAVDKSLTRLRSLAIPSIAAIRGACMGGGCMIALTADFRIATDDSLFAITPAKLGLTITPEQINDLLGLVGVSRAKEMLYTGRRVNAADALGWGLINEIVEVTDLDPQVDKWAEALLTNSQHSVRTFKRVIGEMQKGDHGDAALCEKLYREGFEGADFKEGAAAFLARRPPHFPSNGT